MTTLFNRLFVQPFYAQYAGALLIIVLLAFGFMRPMDHEALITAALASPFLLGLVFMLWSLYTLQTVSFVLARLSEPDHLFLANFRPINRFMRWRVWASVQTGLLLPVIGYAGWMLARAVHYDRWGALGSIIVVVIGLTGIGIGVIDYRLRNPAPDRLRLPRLRFRTPYLLFFPTYWLRHEPLSLLLTKGSSCLVLVGVCRLYPTDAYDERLLLIGLLLSVLVHASISQQLSQFEGRYLLLLDNIPRSVRQRFGQYALLYGLIWLPELSILLKNRPEAVSLLYVGLLWLAGWGWLLLLHALKYGRLVDPDRCVRVLFASFIIGLLMIMSGVPLGVWGLAGWVSALIRTWTRTLPLRATS